MKATLKFSLPEEQQEFLDAQNGSRYKGQIDQIWMEVFRPRRKHGYKDEEINALLEKLGDDGDKLMEKLEDLYRSAVAEWEE